LRLAGLQKVLQGITSMNEVLANTHGHDLSKDLGNGHRHGRSQAPHLSHPQMGS
jgi:hypothetical protein